MAFRTLTFLGGALAAATVALAGCNMENPAFPDTDASTGTTDDSASDSTTNPTIEPTSAGPGSGSTSGSTSDASVSTSDPTDSSSSSGETTSSPGSSSTNDTMQPGPVCGDGNVDQGLAEECDDGNGDHFDECSNECYWNPEKVHFPNDGLSELELIGFEDQFAEFGPCPGDSVAVGVEVQYHVMWSEFANARVLCSDLTLTVKNEAFELKVEGSTPEPWLGPVNGDETDSVHCGENQVLVGFSGLRSEGAVRQLTLRCASISIQENGPGDHSLVLGPPTAGDWVGFNTGFMDGPTDCPFGDVVRELIVVHEQDRITAFSGKCQTPALQYWGP